MILRAMDASPRFGALRGPQRERRWPFTALEIGPNPSARSRSLAREDAGDSVRRGVARDTRALAILAAAVVLASVLPGAVNFIQSEHVNLSASMTAPRTHLAYRASQLSFTLTVLVAVIILIGRRVRIVGSPWGLISLVLLIAYSIGGAAAEGTINLKTVEDSVGLILVVVAVWSLDIRAGSLRVLGICSAAVATYCLVFRLLSYAHANYPDTGGNLFVSSKAVLGTDQVAAIFGHSNTYGIAMALSIPLAFALRRRLWQITTVGIEALGLVMSASRTGMIAAAWCLLSIVICRRQRHGNRIACAAATVLLPAIAVITVPLAVRHASAFTDRGQIWISSAAMWHSHWLLGVGPSWYQQIANFDNSLGVDATSGHNLFVDWFTTAGLAGMILGAAVLTVCSSLAIRSVDGRFGIVATAYIATFLVISIMEYIWIDAIRSELCYIVTFTFAVVTHALDERRAADSASK